MEQSCKNCVFYQPKMDRRFGECTAPFPDSMLSKAKVIVEEDAGKSCPVFKEKQQCET